LKANGQKNDYLSAEEEDIKIARRMFRDEKGNFVEEKTVSNKQATSNS
jgi:hypothetical protein